MHSEFGNGSGSSTHGLQAYCKSCFGEYQRPRTAVYRRNNKEKLLAGNVDAQRINRYGLTPEEYAEMWTAQGGKCWFHFCDRPATAIDHDHETDEVRALLCKYHNVALGAFADRAEFLREAAEYIERFKYRGKFHHTASKCN